MSEVTYDLSDRIAVVTIQRPEVKNAVDGPTAAALAAAFRRFDADREADVAVLTGAGGAFCAGADLKAVADGRGNVTREDEFPPRHFRRGAIVSHAAAAGDQVDFQRPFGFSHNQTPRRQSGSAPFELHVTQKGRPPYFQCHVAPNAPGWVARFDVHHQGVSWAEQGGDVELTSTG